ncbi:MAG: UDP-N-acetylmuramoyl-tripeptide--D-alanyl-D-alanine ligase [Clostridiales bacterium]|nr:UDP-N-acetylmuramoyl-tripeptide--D-alanyl-D-alanine ligase [Clostridiales bacterium]
MTDGVLRIIASLLCACLFSVSTMKTVGAMQQSGYKNRAFWKWLKRGDNLFFNRLCILSLCLLLTTAVTSLCFSFMGHRGALLFSSLPFFALILVFAFVDGRYALKVPTKRTGRLCRLFAVYFFFIAIAAYFLISVLAMLIQIISSDLYGFLGYVPFALLPPLLPVLLSLANLIEGAFEDARNQKFVQRAGRVLDEKQILRIGIVGSYGKTSVKNILKSILLEKYDVVETPESYNTPIGIAKTVYSEGFANKQVLIAEMGARKSGDISELCQMVKPEYAIFTGVCEQHIETFGSLDGVWREKSEIFKSGAKKVFCGESLRSFMKEEYKTEISYAENVVVEDVALEATKTKFTLCIDGEEIVVETALLGNAAIENVRLAVALALELGLTVKEIGAGLQKAQPIPHRLQLLENNGVYILDDAYNCNPRGAEEAIKALSRFTGRKCIVTPGIVECGVLEDGVNQRLGAQIAEANLDKVVLVGDTLVGVVKTGYSNASGDMQKLCIAEDLEAAQAILSDWVQAGDAVLFLNDLPDVY